jgi:hypothetical protein
MAYVNKRSGKNGAKRFTGLYKAVDGTYKSAGTFDTEERALEVAPATERHAHRRYRGEHQGTYARHLTLHVIPYIGKQRVAEVSRETIHRLLTVVLKEGGASQTTILHTRTALSAMLQMAWDNGYRKDNPVRGIKLKGVPAKPIIMATKDQFLRVYNALRRGHASRAQIHRGSDREVPSHRGPVSHEGVHQERRASPVQGRSCGLGNGAGAHRA